MLRVIREVLHFQPRGRRTNIPGALHFLNGVTRRRAVTFLVSDFMAEGYEVPLRVANRRHDVIAVHVSDPREEFLPDVGLVAVEDAESGHETLVDTSVRSVREEYPRRPAAQRKRGTKFSAGRAWTSSACAPPVVCERALPLFCACASGGMANEAT